MSTQATNKCSKSLNIAYPAWSRTNIATESIETFRLDHELLAAILYQAGCSFTETTLPFKRTLNSIKQGTIDGTVAISKNSERESFAYFSAPYRPEIIAIFMRSNDIANFTPTKVSDLLSFPGQISAGIGTWHGAEFENLITSNREFKNRVLYIDDAPIMHQSVLRGRSRLFVGDLHYSTHILKQTGIYGKILPHSFLLNEEDVHLIFSKKTIAISDLKVIDNAIVTFRKSAEYQSILSKYTSGVEIPPSP